MTRTRWKRSTVAAIAGIAMAVGPMGLAPSPAAADAPDTEIVAWGTSDATADLLQVPENVQSASIRQIVAGGTGYPSFSGAFALTDEGKILTWGQLSTDDVVPGAVQADTIASIGRWKAVANWALSTSGKPYVWGSETTVAKTKAIPAGVGTLTSMAVASTVAVGVRTDGTVAVWGGYTTGGVQVAPLANDVPDEFEDPATSHVKQAVVLNNAVGDAAVLVVRDDGTVDSWGADISSAISQIPADLGPVASLVLHPSANQVGAILEDGGYVTWGSSESSGWRDFWTLPLDEGDHLASVSSDSNFKGAGILAVTTDHRLIVGEYDSDDGRELAASTPWELIEGRKVLDVASAGTANYVLTTDPDPIGAVADPTVTGEVAVGATLTGVPGTFTGGEVTNQWLAAGRPIAGETSTSLELTRAQVGKRISFRSTATLGDDTAVSTSEETDAVYEFGATTLPAITGTPKVGQTLTRTPAVFNGPTGLLETNTWTVGAREVGAADGGQAETYVVQPEDEGETITISSRKAAFVGGALMDVTVTSDGAGPVVAAGAADPVSVTSHSTLSGTAKVGRELTGTPASFAGAPDGVAHQWLADGEVISGASGTSYTPAEADEYKRIQFRTVATKGGQTVTSTTDPSAPVQPGLLLDDATGIEGTAKVGSTLTGTPATFLGSPDEVVQEWLVSDSEEDAENGDGETTAAVEGEAGYTLKLTGAHVGKWISFVSTATRGDDELVSASAALGSVAPDDTLIQVAGAGSTTGAAVTWTATVTAGSGTPTGTVTASTDGMDDVTAPLSGGTASLALPAGLTVGSHTVTVSYAGGGGFAASSTTKTLTVSTPPPAKVTPVVTLKVIKAPTMKKAGKATITVIGGTPATGAVTVTATGKVKKGKKAKKKAFTVTGALGGGTASVKIKKIKNAKGKWTLTVAYAGDATHNPAVSSPVKIKVKKK